MKKTTFVISVLILLAGCVTATPAPFAVPTLAVLPTQAPSATLTPSQIPTWTLTPTQAPSVTLAPSSTPTPLPTDTLTLTATDTPLPTDTLTLTPSDTATDTPTPAPTNTYTPSLTITNTITPTITPTFTPSPELDSLGMLALLSERATILPPQMLYNPSTLTAVAFDALTLIAASAAPPAPLPGTPLPGEPGLATLPPPLSVTCTSAFPGGLGTAFASDPSLAQSIGCPQGQLISTTTAVESFEHGTMIFIQGSPGSIYALTLDGRFRRFDDTWVSGVDPESGGETPPLGLIEPKRGFGKVWRNNLDVRGSLGWAVTEEAGATSSVQSFDRGRAVYLPSLGETILLIDDLGGATGSRRSLPASF